jgi:2,4-dienoyl-CoA reductase-like NADH-dependent reductase (Old Yellow Enzyme family)
MLSPMCMYSAQDGLADDYHMTHLGRFALGGVGIVMTEAVAVEERDRCGLG